MLEKHLDSRRYFVLTAVLSFLANAPARAGQPEHPSSTSPTTSASTTAHIITRAEGAYAWAKKGLAYKEHNHFHEAVQCCNSALRLNPDCELAYDVRGRAEVSLGDLESAIKDIKKAMSLHKGTADASIYWSLADAHVGKGDFPAAIQDITTAMSLEPNNPYWSKRRGEIYSQARQYKEAISDCSKFIKAMPKDVSGWIARGDTYFAAGQYQKAVDDYSVAIKMKPTDFKMYGVRAAAYERLGRKDLAAEDRKKTNLGKSNWFY